MDSSPGSLKNPRRRPATESVSLIHRRSKSPSVGNDRDDSSMQVDAASDEPARPLTKKDSSGESSNAERWFEKSNNAIKSSANLDSFTQDDPPFLFQNSSSEQTPPIIGQQRASHPSGFQNPSESASDDYRSVIDDLTIENKRLKQRLKTFERVRNAKLNSDALFEIRYHPAMPAEKRKQLESILQDFVTKVTPSPNHSTIVPESSSMVPSSLLPFPSSSSSAWINSSKSHSKQGDSGYASMSLSGMNNSSKEGPEKQVSIIQRQQDIQDYLSDIPAGLLPSRMGPMADKEKKKLIVHKLEQLFIGRDSSGAHKQPKQQERVAQAAARYDRKVDTAVDQGSREAKIMPKAQDVPGKNSHSSDSRSKSDTTNVQDISMQDLQDVTEQRPTRPLDLDPHRAQIPSENLQYIRHLGFSPPYEEEMMAHVDGRGWIYLNVLTNMAQLHFTNVTTHFIQKAVSDYSKMLEISSDGRKVRWKGGMEMSSFSGESSPDDHQQPHVALSRKNFARLGAVQSQLPGKISSRRNPRGEFAYSPLFRPGGSSETDAQADEEIPYPTSNQYGQSPGVTSSGYRKSEQQMNVDSAAPLIFYQNLPFYTDLSGDPTNSFKLPVSKPSQYKINTLTPIGGRLDQNAKTARRREHEVDKGPLSTMKQSLAGSLDDTPISASPSNYSMELQILDKTEASLTSNNPDPMDLEVSGMGGVEPADNFAINVKSRQHRENVLGGSLTKVNRRPYENSILKAWIRKQKLVSATSTSSPDESSSESRTVKFPTKMIVTREIIGENLKDMKPSEFPSAVYLAHETDDDDDDDEDDNDDDDDGDDDDDDDDDHYGDGDEDEKIDDLNKYETEDSDVDEEPPTVPLKTDSLSMAHSSKYSTDDDDEYGSGRKHNNAISGHDQEEDNFSQSSLLAHTSQNIQTSTPSFRKGGQSTQASRISAHDHALRTTEHNQQNLFNLPMKYSGVSNRLRQNQTHQIGLQNDDFEKKETDRQDDDSTDSMDLLSTARRVDPESIRLKEREFDADVADRLAEEIPAGSSAATAEGGSGYNSPNPHYNTAPGGVTGSMGPPLRGNALVENAKSRMKGKKRARTSDEDFSVSAALRARKSPKITDTDSRESDEDQNDLKERIDQN